MHFTIDFIFCVIYYLVKIWAIKVCPRQMLPTIICDVQDTGLWSQRIASVLMTSSFVYMVCALYKELMSQLEPDVAHHQWVTP